MTKVRINGGIHEVEVDIDSPDLTYVIERARKLWDDTRPPVKTSGITAGFTVTQVEQSNWKPALVGLKARCWA